MEGSFKKRIRLIIYEQKDHGTDNDHLGSWHGQGSIEMIKKGTYKEIRGNARVECSSADAKLGDSFTAESLPLFPLSNSQACGKKLPP